MAMLGGNPTSASPAGTSMLYAGEQFDTSLQMYYNRARYYDQNIGRFNRMDPYAGSTQDPQSLHKYLYVHNNPVNNVDPTGRLSFSIAGLSTSMSIGIVIFVIAIFSTVAILDLSFERGPDPWESLRAPSVNAEMRRAYIQSNVGMGPALAREQGGYIVSTPMGIYSAVRWPVGVNNQISVRIVPTGRIGNDKIVGSFHTHPNVGPGWVQGPSPQDIEKFKLHPSTFGYVEFVVSRDRIYIIKRSFIFGRVKWRDFAPTLGNAR